MLASKQMKKTHKGANKHVIKQANKKSGRLEGQIWVWMWYH